MIDTEKPIFAVVHKVCRHVAAVHNDPELAEMVAKNLWPRQSDWFVRQGTDYDIHSLMQGQSCLRCDQNQTMP